MILGHQNGVYMLILAELNGLRRKEFHKMYFLRVLYTLGEVLDILFPEFIFMIVKEALKIFVIKRKHWNKRYKLPVIKERSHGDCNVQ